VQNKLVPLLKSKLHNQWLDPLTCPNQEEFIRAYNVDFAFAKVAQELLNLLDENSLTKQLQKIDLDIEIANATE